MLSGMGGDEVFAGYPRQMAMKIASAFDPVPNLLRRPLMKTVAGALPGGLPGRLTAPLRNAKKFARSAALDFEDRYLGYGTYFTNEMKQRLYSDEWRATHARIRSLRHASRLLRARRRCRAAEPASLRRSENVSAVSESDDDRQDVDGRESRGARAVSESRDDRDGRAHAAAVEAAWAEAEVRSEASARRCPAEGCGLAEEGGLWGADPVVAARAAAADD